jgi:hypothetical protein
MYGRDTAGEKPLPDRFVRLFHPFLSPALSIARIGAQPSSGSSVSVGVRP